MSERELNCFLSQPREFLKHLDDVYPPLSPEKREIRLARLQPARHLVDDLRLDLKVVSLDDGPKYDAISYTWGNMTKTRIIYVNGLPYNVTYNQDECLRRMRYPRKTRTIWMDIVSINQAKLAEKSQQVNMMADIYSSSCGTKIWLGEPAEDWFGQELAGHELAEWQRSLEAGVVSGEIDVSDRQRPKKKGHSNLGCDDWIYNALKILHTLNKGRHIYELPFWYVDQGQPLILPGWYRTLDALLAIMKRPWWNRVWVLQEALLSPIPATVKVGQYTRSLDMLIGGIVRLRQHIIGDDRAKIGCSCGNMLSAFCNPSEWTDRLREVCISICLFDRVRNRFEQKRVDPVVALVASGNGNATDPRDHINAIFGLMSEPWKGLFHLQQSYSLNVAQTFAATTANLIECESSLFLLHKCVGVGADNRHGLPSWATDWSATSLKREDKGSIEFKGSVYLWLDNFSYVEPQAISFDMSEMKLTVPATHIDTVASVSTSRNRTDTTKDIHAHAFRKKSSQWLTYLQKKGKPPRRLRCERWRSKREKLRLKQEMLLWQLIARISQSAVDFAKYESDDVLRSVLRYRHRKNSCSTSHYRFLVKCLAEDMQGFNIFRTKSQKFGIGSSNVRPGDQLFLFKGCKTLLILRPGTSAPRYSVVGDCFIHNLKESCLENRVETDISLF